MKSKLFFSLLAILSLSLFWTSCSDEEPGNMVQPPVVNFNIENNNCEAACDVTFTNTSISQGTTMLSWDFGDNGSAGNVESVNHTYTQAGTYQVILTAQNEGGTDTETKTVTILGDGTVVVQPPVANFNISNNNCEAPCDVVFENTSISEGTTTLNWDFGDGSSAGNQSSVSHTFTTGGTYDVTLSAQNSAGTDSETKTVTILGNSTELPVVDFTIQNNNCEGPCSVSFSSTTTSPTPVTYAWVFNDGNTAGNVSNVSNTFFQPGTYNVILTATNSAGSVSKTKVVTIAESTTINYTYVNFSFTNSSLTLLPFTIESPNMISYIIKDDLGQTIANGSSNSAQFPINFGFSGVNSERFYETYTFTVTNNANTASFTFVPADYAPQNADNCVIPNIVQNGIGINLGFCWLN